MKTKLRFLQAIPVLCIVISILGISFFVNFNSIVNNNASAEELHCCAPDFLRTKTNSTPNQYGACVYTNGPDVIECPIECCPDIPGLICTPKTCRAPQLWDCRGDITGTACEEPSI
jgi:hypothetical protein